MIFNKYLKMSLPKIFIFSMLLIVLPCSAYAATISVLNQDGANEGFNDPTPVSPEGGNPGLTLGEQRLNALRFAADIVEGLLPTDSPVVIEVGANFDDLGDCEITPELTVSAILGGAGPETVHKDFSSAPLADTWYTQAQANALEAVDLDPGNNDAGAVFNTSIDDGFVCSSSLGGLLINWYYGYDQIVQEIIGVNFEIDFVSIVIHELIHAVGFLTLVDLQTGAELLGSPDTYSFQLEDHPSGMAWPDMTDAQRLVSTTSGGNLHWTGANVVSALGQHKGMYDPVTVEAGSSVSHFELIGTELMEPSYSGPNHNPGLAESLLSDIGWDLVGCTVSESPETSCSDGIDNDCDGAVDSNDLDCPQPCVPTQTVELDCQDGLDNDCNDLTDGDDANCQVVCEAPGCTITESPESTCDDSIDNDCDGLVDENDADCTSSECTLAQVGDSCTLDGECCTNKCKGAPGRKTCK